MEQESNALALSSLGLGQVMIELDAEIIQQWLLTQHSFSKTKIPDVANAIVNWLLDSQRVPISTLADGLW